jgi:DNA-binding transcriptional ArsR family regulator
MQSVREFSRLMRALASRSRLEILQALVAEKNMTVTELRVHVPISQPLLSWHLSILRRAELVDSTKDGRLVRYAINPAGFQQITQGIEELLATEKDADADASLAKQAAG